MQMITIVFALIILCGAALLTLPCASRSGTSCGFFPALFTATSCTCVTGLALFDTWTQWSGFGQIVILCLIELGGLGFMSVASFVIFLFGKKIGMKQRMVIAQAFSLSDMESVVKMQKVVIFGSLGIQFAGALALFFRFLPEFGWLRAVRWGIFHSVSAFCNAGFDIFGVLKPGVSLELFQQDPVTLMILGTLVSVGGLGFFVWEEVIRIRRWKRLSVYTKLVLLTTLVLLVGGALSFCMLEWNNPETIGDLSVRDKLFNGIFQSMTTRTAGFAAIPQGGLTDAGKAVTILWMLIGGASGSTAGGIKVVTVVVLLLFLWTRIRGKSTVSVFRHTIPEHQVMDAAVIVLMVVGLTFFGGVFLSIDSGVDFTDALYEVASALATVGLTTGITTTLSMPSLMLLIVYMFFGRVGILTISLGFLMGNRASERFHYAQANFLIG